MTEPKSARRRAVRLSDEGRQLLTNALLERWGATGQKGKLTREGRAAVLGVSVVTADRIVRGQGVDRSTLLYAFANIGLPWDDALLQQDKPPEASPAVPPQRRRTWWWVAAAGASALLLLADSSRLPQREDAAWLHPFGQFLTAGTEDYQKGDYKAAGPKLAEAVRLARIHKSAPHMASALRMVADLEAAQGDLGRAASGYQQVLTLRSVFGEQKSEGAVREALAGVLIKLGRFAEAQEEVSQALDLYRKYGDPMGVAITLRTQAVLSLAQNQVEDAEQAVQAAFDCDPRVKESDLASDLRIQLAVAAEKKGDVETSRRLLGNELAFWKAKAHPRWIASLELRLGELDLKQGRAEQARSRLTSSMGRYAALGDRRGEALAREQISRL